MKKVFCPKCKSTDVEKDINVFLTAGAPQQWKCNKCGFHNWEFPIKEELNKSAIKNKK